MPPRSNAAGTCKQTEIESGDRKAKSMRRKRTIVLSANASPPTVAARGEARWPTKKTPNTSALVFCTPVKKRRKAPGLMPTRGRFGVGVGFGLGGVDRSILGPGVGSGDAAMVLRGEARSSSSRWGICICRCAETRGWRSFLGGGRFWVEVEVANLKWRIQRK
jgi:hypothetical protein